MKKILSLIIFSVLTLSSSSLFSQTEKLVFMIDPRIDLNKLGSTSGLALSIGKSAKAPFVLTSSVYTYDKVLNKIVISPGNKTSALPIDPSKATFFIVESGKKFIVSFDPNTLSFMGPDGEEVIPPLRPVGTRNFFASDFSEKPGNTSITDENTTANLLNKDRKNAIIGRIDVPTAKPKIRIVCGFAETRNGGTTVYSVALPDGGRTILQVVERGNGNTGAAGVLNKGRALGDKLIELSQQCNGENQPNYCSTRENQQERRESQDLLTLEIQKISGFETLPPNNQFETFVQLIQGLTSIK